MTLPYFFTETKDGSFKSVFNVSHIFCSLRCFCVRITQGYDILDIILLIFIVHYLPSCFSSSCKKCVVLLVFHHRRAFSYAVFSLYFFWCLSFYYKERGGGGSVLQNSPCISYPCTCLQLVCVVDYTCIWRRGVFGVLHSFLSSFIS